MRRFIYLFLFLLSVSVFLPSINGLVYAQTNVIQEAPRLAPVLLNIVNFLLSIFAVISVIVFVVTGIMYFLAGGNQKAIDMAKRINFYAATGALITLSALVIVRFLGSFF